MKRKRLKTNASVTLKTKASVTLIASVMLVFGAWYTGLIPPYEAQAAPGDLTVTVTYGLLTATNVTMHLELKDNEVTVISRDFSENYTQTVGLTVDVRDSIQRQMQNAIDDYRKLEVTKAQQGYINAASILKEQLDLTKEL